MNGIFISYRRDDSAGHAGRIHDRLADHYGHERVFRDVEDIGAGEDFIDVLEDAVGKCDVLVVVIGPNWLTVTDEAGRRRLDDPDDVLRLEVASALKRADIRVIPVLVNGATMPKAAELPEEIRDLAYRNALEVRETRFEDDLKQLIAAIGGRKAIRLLSLAQAGGLVAFAVAAVTLTVMLLSGKPDVVAGITLYEGGGQLPRADTAAILPIELPDTAPGIENRARDNTLPYSVTYWWSGDDDRVRIAPDFPYRDLLARGSPVLSGATAINWDWPRLAVKVVNGSDQPIFLEEVRLTIERSEIDTEPIVMINSLDLSLSIANHGWGPMVDPAIRIRIVEGEECTDTTWRDYSLAPLDLSGGSVRWIGPVQEGTASPGDPGTTMRFNVREHLPPEFEDEWQPLCLVGTLDYRTEDDDERSLRFKTRISWPMATAASTSMVLPLGEYYIFLEAGASDTTISRSIEIGVPPGEFAHFLLRVGTDRSAAFDLEVDLIAAGGKRIPAGDVRLEILTPVYDPDGLRNRNRHR